MEVDGADECECDRDRECECECDGGDSGQQSTRAVLVTGASRGIGLGLVEGLAAMESPPEYIIATCRKPEEAKELQKVCQKAKNLKILQLDVTNEESRQAAVKKVEELVGEKGLNCLINNAAINVMANLEQVTSEMMLQVYETNTVAPLMVAKAFLPLLKSAAAKEESEMGWHRAAIINIVCDSGSIQKAEENPDFLSVYPLRISKTALNMVTKSLSMDLKANGILCMSLNPGFVMTDMGGCNAEMKVQDIVPPMLSLFGHLSEKDTGTFQDYKGETIPW